MIVKAYSFSSERYIGFGKVNFVETVESLEINTLEAGNVTTEPGTIVAVGVPLTTVLNSIVIGSKSSLVKKYNSKDVINAPPVSSIKKDWASGSPPPPPRGAGGGGGGGANATTGTSRVGGNGGSGTMILRYPNTFSITLGSGVASSAGEQTDGSDKYIELTGTGTVSWA